MIAVFRNSDRRYSSFGEQSSDELFVTNQLKGEKLLSQTSRSDLLYTERDRILGLVNST